MTYEEANILREAKKGLIGSVDEQGFKVDDILIVPSNSDAQNLFFEQYLQDFDNYSALIPFLEQDLQVWAVDIKDTLESNVLFFDIIGQ